MANVMSEPMCVREAASSSSFGVRFKCSRIRASQPRNHNHSFYKQMGMFALRKKIEDSILSAEILAPTAIEQEEVRRIEQQQVIRERNLWDDLPKTDEILVRLAESDNMVDCLKDLRFKAEEAKLIMELAETDIINDGLFKQAYTSSVDVSKFLKRYEMFKYLKEPYDREGACLTIESGDGGTHDQRWAEKLVQMYVKWAGKQGHKCRIVERLPSKGAGIKFATIEFESKFVYGYLMGERGTHHLITTLRHNSSEIVEGWYSLNSMPLNTNISFVTFVLNEVQASLASVDVIPLFLESAPNIFIDENDLLISSSLDGEEERSFAGPSVHIRHIPSGLTVKSTGERSPFANKMKAMNRLKAKLLAVLKNQRIPRIEDIDKDAVVDVWSQETRRYVLHPAKLVDDVKTGIQLNGINSVLNGSIDPLITAHLRNRCSSDSI